MAVGLEGSKFLSAFAFVEMLGRALSSNGDRDLSWDVSSKKP